MNLSEWFRPPKLYVTVGIIAVALYLYWKYRQSHPTRAPTSNGQGPRHKKGGHRYKAQGYQPINTNT